MILKQAFNAQSVKTKALTLLIEHGPCCILSGAASVVGISFLNHNPGLELGFALGGAILGEHIGHKIFHRSSIDCSGRGWQGKARRYALALSFGLASWGAHQVFFHKHDGAGDEAHEGRHDHVFVPEKGLPLLI